MFLGHNKSNYITHFVVLYNREEKRQVNLNQLENSQNTIPKYIRSLQDENETLLSLAKRLAK